ncbi:hypothetical protein V8B97DRAFT_1925384 [Scleroderma yunnanense]
MVKNRKSAPKTSQGDPKDVDIPEEEQWRLVRESGVLSEVAPVAKNEPNDGPLPLAEEIFDASVIIMPMTFFLIMMEILIHHQYGRQPTLGEVAQKLLTTVPIMSIFMFYTIRHKHNIRVQVILFLLSLGVGPRMIWLVNRGSWLTNMAQVRRLPFPVAALFTAILQCPQSATIWLYTVLQLNLPLALLSLGLIGAWTWWSGLKLLL